MKLKGFVLLNSVLTMILLILPTLSVNGMEKTNYGKDHNLESHSEVTTVIAAAPQGSNNGSKSADNGGFISKHTTELEFTFAIATIIVGLLISDKWQKNQEQQERAKRERIEATAVDNNKSESEYLIVAENKS